MKARNELGWSAYSDEKEITTATVPDTPVIKPLILTSDSVQGIKVAIDWEQPANNGFAVEKYKVFWKKTDETFPPDPPATAKDITCDPDCPEAD